MQFSRSLRVSSFLNAFGYLRTRDVKKPVDEFAVDPIEP